MSPSSLDDPRCVGEELEESNPLHSRQLHQRRTDAIPDGLRSRDEVLRVHLQCQVVAHAREGRVRLFLLRKKREKKTWSVVLHHCYYTNTQWENLQEMSAVVKWDYMDNWSLNCNFMKASLGDVHLAYMDVLLYEGSDRAIFFRTDLSRELLPLRRAPDQAW